MIRNDRGETVSREIAREFLHASRKPASGITRLTKPMRKASCASINFEVNISSIALPVPTMRGSIHASPYSATKPRFEKIAENFAFSDANRKSQYSGTMNPSPTDAPLIAAIIGFGTDNNHACFFRKSARTLSSVMASVRKLARGDDSCESVESKLISAPAQNPFPIGTGLNDHANTVVGAAP